MKAKLTSVSILLCALGHFVADAAERAPNWVAPMKKVHAKFKGDAGVFAQFGDSITYSRAFWSSLRYKRNNAPADLQKAFKMVSDRMIEDCWDRKGPEYGNQGRMTVRWAHDNVAKWLEKLNPEVAIVMFGTNDLNSVPADEYEKKMREVVVRCLDNGTIAILTTIPPRHKFVEKSARYAAIVRTIADELNVPLVDYHVEIRKRRPDDWNGALDKFQEYKGYDVPTLISRDGVHPSAPKMFRGDFSTESLSQNGFALRNYLTLLKYGEVIEQVLSTK